MSAVDTTTRPRPDALSEDQADAVTQAICACIRQLPGVDPVTHADTVYPQLSDELRAAIGGTEAEQRAKLRTLCEDEARDWEHRPVAAKRRHQ
jgi:hypothetical protein